MLVPLSWLKEYVDISEVRVDELQRKMSAAGLSVERKYTVGEGISGVVIGEIVSLDKHCDSNHLFVCKIDLGMALVQVADGDSFNNLLAVPDEKRYVQVVTGAQNVYLHGKVPVALPGQVLPGGSVIEATELRGVLSSGMLCSEYELGLGENNEGIMMLGDDAPVGGRLVDYLGLPDVVFDVEVTANRGDCLSMVGIAREVATLLNKQVIMPPLKKLATLSAPNYSVSVVIDNVQACSRFAIVAYEDFTLGPSPLWMQQRLIRAGMRPINTIVDISNYVMLELGQPSHVYDASCVSQHSFVVRDAHPNERLQTLDGHVYDLSPSHLVVADTASCLSLAGIIGGQSSMITSQTRAFFLEVAHFDPVVVRQAGIKLGIRTDATVRFERGVDVALVPLALERLHYLLTTITGARQVSSVVDVYPAPVEQHFVTLRSSQLYKYLHTDLSVSYVEDILQSLGFEVVSRDGGDTEWLLTVVVPSWRIRDITLEEDLIEEVARIYGYDNIVPRIPSGTVPYVVVNKRLRIKRRLLEIMRGFGFQELLTYSFNSKAQIEQSGYSVLDALELASPLSEDHRYLRLSLLPNILSIVHANSSLGKDFSLFEVSSVYIHKLMDIVSDEAVSLAFEPLHFAGVVYLHKYSFDSAHALVRGTLQGVFDQLHLTGISYSQSPFSLHKIRHSVMYHPGRVGVVLFKDQAIGLFGEIHPVYAEQIGLRQQVYMFEINFDVLVDDAFLVPQFRHYSVYPVTTESLSFILPERISLGPIVQSLRSLDARIVDVHCSAPFYGSPVPQGSKAVTFTFKFQSYTGPIKEADATVLRSRLITYMQDMYGGILRS